MGNLAEHHEQVRNGAQSEADIHKMRATRAKLYMGLFSACAAIPVLIPLMKLEEEINPYMKPLGFDLDPTFPGINSVDEMLNLTYFVVAVLGAYLADWVRRDNRKSELNRRSYAEWNEEQRVRCEQRGY